MAEYRDYKMLYGISMIDRYLTDCLKTSFNLVVVNTLTLRPRPRPRLESEPNGYKTIAVRIKLIINLRVTEL